MQSPSFKRCEDDDFLKKRAIDSVENVTSPKEESEGANFKKKDNSSDKVLCQKVLDTPFGVQLQYSKKGCQ